MHGFLNLHKAQGWTSHDCVAKSRRLLNTKKIGHGGTLDPLATGVLPLAIGRATRLLQYLPTHKAYRAIVRFGLTTNTDDLEGTPQIQTAAPDLTPKVIEAALPGFIGQIQQRPPMYSAIQVNGKRLYELARKGKTLDEIPLRTVTIHHIRCIHWQPGDFPEMTLDIACGSGTYIRSIARDLGELLGTGATLAGLIRTQSSGFSLDTSQSIEALQTQIEAGKFHPIPPHQALQHLDAIHLPDEDGRRWCQGQRPIVATDLPLETPLRVLNATDDFLGVGLIQNIENIPKLIPKVVFAA